MTQTIDFGASVVFGTHCFYVEISASPREAVRIYEDYGPGGVVEDYLAYVALHIGEHRADIFDWRVLQLVYIGHPLVIKIDSMREPSSVAR